ncbi:MAG: hypothetical protein WAL99_01425 [Pseudonocardiaceae bacterium]
MFGTVYAQSVAQWSHDHARTRPVSAVRRVRSLVRQYGHASESVAVVLVLVSVSGAVIGSLASGALDGGTGPAAGSWG